MSLRRFLLKEKPAAILLCLKDTQQSWYPSKLAKYSGASYVYVTQWLTKLEKAGWVKLEKKGRLKNVVASESGLAIASSLDELVHKLNTLGSKSAPSAQAAESESTKKQPKDSAQKEEKKD